MATPVTDVVLSTANGANGTSLVDDVVRLAATTGARDAQGASSRYARAATGPGEVFTQHVQQALTSLDLTPASQSSTAELSKVLYGLFQAIDGESGPLPKPVDMVSGLQQMIDELQSASAPGTNTTQLRPQLAQLRADFEALVKGTTGNSSHFTSTLITFLKALQQNLPAWPPSAAAVGGAVNAVA